MAQAQKETRLALEHRPGYRSRRGRNWFFLGLLYAGFYLCRYNLSTVTPEISREFQLDNRQIGWLSTSRDIGYAVGTFLNGLFADALGGKQSMAIGALGTIVLNLVFGGFSTLHFDLGMMVLGMVLLRGVDGYAQSFGSPGMVKINTAWFLRHERGKFAGVFGAMIQLGQIGVNLLSRALLKGFPLAIAGMTLFVVPGLNWRVMFVVPPIILGVLLLLMWLNVRNHPEQVGYRIEHDDDAPVDDPTARLPLRTVFVRIAGNPLIWMNAGAYLCTGFVRRAYDFWWVKYLEEYWHIDKKADEFWWLGILLPTAAIAGSFGAGFLSDTFFKSRRSPVAAALYLLETVVILGAILVLGGPAASPFMACAFLTLISLTCNTSHSIIGTAAVMDIGGRRMAGFALGVVNSFQYLGAILAGFALGGVIDRYGWNALFWSMLPFSALGAFLMLCVAWSTRGRDVKGS